MNIRLLLILWFALIMGSCSENEQGKERLDPRNEETSKVKFEFAEFLSIDKAGNKVEIQIIDPNLNKTTHHYSLLKQTLPFENISVLSTTHIGMIAALNRTEVISSFSDISLVHNEELKEQKRANRLIETGGFGLANLEVFLSISPSAIIYSGFDENNPILEKLAAANLKTLANYEWKETHPLGRAEWVKYFGVLLGEEAKADSVFNQVKLNYNRIKDSIATYAKSHPTVLVGTPFGDQFNVPAGNSYMAKMLNDLKVNYVYANTEGVASHSYSLEKVISENKHTDFWINVAASNKEKLLQLNNKFDLLDAVHNGGTFSYFSNVNQFWEESAIRPDLLLLDLAAIFHPDLFNREQMRYYSVVR